MIIVLLRVLIYMIIARAVQMTLDLENLSQVEVSYVRSFHLSMKEWNDLLPATCQML
jgi:hypothetical protein